MKAPNVLRLPTRFRHRSPGTVSMLSRLISQAETLEMRPRLNLASARCGSSRSAVSTAVSASTKSQAFVDVIPT